MSNRTDKLIDDIFDGEEVAKEEIKKHVQNTKLTRNLATKRKSKKISQKEMAKKMGVSQGTVSNFEQKSICEINLGELFSYLNVLELHGDIVISSGNHSPQAKYVYYIEQAIECLHKMNEFEDQTLREGNLKLALEGINQMQKRSGLLQTDLAPYQEFHVNEELTTEKC
jgi:transcriptional regulator with XRE-family HTH domain